MFVSCEFFNFRCSLLPHLGVCLHFFFSFCLTKTPALTKTTESWFTPNH